MVRELLQLGNPSLYEVSEPVTEADLDNIQDWVTDLHDTLQVHCSSRRAPRAIAAPQIGIPKRLFYLYQDHPCVFVNPTLHFPDSEKYMMLDDCLSFPGLIVKVERHRRVIIDYYDRELHPQSLDLTDELAELVQHECDHLNGILATMRAVDSRSFYLAQIQRNY